MPEGKIITLKRLSTGTKALVRGKGTIGLDLGVKVKPGGLHGR